jgi:hypothetical protein
MINSTYMLLLINAVVDLMMIYMINDLINTANRSITCFFLNSSFYEFRDSVCGFACKYPSRGAVSLEILLSQELKKRKSICMRVYIA